MTTSDFIKGIRYWAVVAMLTLAPIAFYVGVQDIRGYQETFFEFLGMVIIATFIGNFWISAFLLLNIFLFIFSGAQVGMNQVFNILIGSLLFAFCRSYFRTVKVEGFFKYLYILLAVNLLFMVAQLFSVDPIHLPVSASGQLMNHVFNDPIGLMNLKSFNGIFITIVTPLVALANPLIALAMIIPVLLCKSSGAILAFAVAFLIWIYNKHTTWFNLALIAVIIATVSFLALDNKDDHSTFKSRLPMWSATIQRSLVYPIGYGPDSFRSHNAHKNFLFTSDADYNTGIETILDKEHKEFKYYSPSNDSAWVDSMTRKLQEKGFKNGEYNFWDNPHNDYLKILFENGILGLILAFGLIREIIMRFRLSLKTDVQLALFCALSVYFVSSLVQFPFDLARTSCLFPIILAAFYQETDEKAI